MCPDIERYRVYLKDQNLTREQEDTIIHTLYAALEKLADRHFAMDAVSLAAEANALADSYQRAAVPDCQNTKPATD